MDAYPYFIYPAICELRRNPDPERSERLKQFIAVNVGDREALLRLIGNLDIELIDFYPDDKSHNEDIADSIDSFISKFSKSAPPPVPPSLLPVEENEKVEIETSLPEPETQTEQPERPVSQEDVMEKVKMMVKNRDYGGALEIMEAFYLNNPKKSVYFADQIRFLRKLKLNESKKQ